jgi:hypothetical protein
MRAQLVAGYPLSLPSAVPHGCVRPGMVLYAGVRDRRPIHAAGATRCSALLAACIEKTVRACADLLQLVIIFSTT